MNAAHFHLMLNHFPLIGFFFSFLILVLGFISKNESYVRAGLFMFVLSGVLSVVTFLTGEPAEKIIEQSSGFSEKLVEAHEEAAELVIWFIGATSLLSAAALYFSFIKKNIPRALVFGIMAVAAISLIDTARTNNLGGKISHPEVRGPSSAQPSPGEESK